MTKEDWTNIGLKLIGVYLTIIYGSALVAETIAAYASTQVGRQVGQNSGPVFWRGLYVWQGPLSSSLIILAGIALMTKTKRITSWLWRGTNHAEQVSSPNDR